MTASVDILFMRPIHVVNKIKPLTYFFTFRYVLFRSLSNNMSYIQMRRLRVGNIRRGNTKSNIHSGSEPTRTISSSRGNRIHITCICMLKQTNSDPPRHVSVLWGSLLNFHGRGKYKNRTWSSVYGVRIMFKMYRIKLLAGDELWSNKNVHYQCGPLHAV